jgi:NAD(P)-dependent dehydrogenase (short-subunit alcohol dehydrogenase family)
MTEPTAARKVVLVTGVSSGIGEAIARKLAAAGYRVFGSVRSGSVPDGVERVVLDVRDDASIAAAVASIRERAGRIDALVNNAGGTLVGAIEETETAQAQALFDVNFFGAVRVTRAVLPAMRAQRSGRIVFVSSLVGFLPAPFMGFYAASKHALEGYSESLDHEVRPFGVRAVLVEPGFIKTKIDSSATRAAAEIDDYAAVRARVAAGLNASVDAGDDPALVAGVVARALAARSPRLRYQAGKGARMLFVLRRVMPAPLVDRALRRQLKLDAGG